MKINDDKVKERVDIFLASKTLVDSIVSEHGLEIYRAGQVFGSTSTYTKVDQHIDHVIRVANWLLDKED